MEIMEKLLYLFDAEPAVIEGLCAWLERRPDIKVVAKAESVKDALSIIDSACIDETKRIVAVTDLSFRRIGEQKNIDGLRILKAIADSKKPIKALVFSSLDMGGYLRTCMSPKYGATGFLSKECNRDTFFEALDCLYDDKPYFSERLKTVLDETENIYGKLSKTERIVLKLMLSDLTNHEIAERLDISIRTVENHVSHIYGKAKAYDRYALFIKVGGGDIDI